MKVTKRVFVGISIFVLLLFQIGIFLPQEFTYERAVWVKATPEAIFPYVNNLQKWEIWTVWNKETDRTYSETFEGIEEGAGSLKKWESEKHGDGSIEIILSIEDRLIIYDKVIQEKGFKINGKIELIETDGGTTVIWTEEGDFGYNIVGRYLGLLMDTFEGEKLKEGLFNLKNICEESQN